MRERPIAYDAPEARVASIAATRASGDGRGGPSARPVTHSYSAVMLQTAGRTRVELREAWRLEAGDALIVPAGQAHRLIEQRGAQYWGLSTYVGAQGAEGEAEGARSPFERVREGGAAVVRVAAERQDFLESLFRELAQGAGRAREAERRSLLTLILAELSRAAWREPSDEARGREAGGVVSESLRYIERHALRRLTLEELSAAVGRSPAYVTTALTRATGRSAGAWITEARMAEARRLLRHGDERVDVVGERVGYADATHFVRTFRRAHGLTPAAFRASERGR